MLNETDSALLGREYIVLVFLQIFKVVSGFASPLGINGLLRYDARRYCTTTLLIHIYSYLETGGKESVVRPWVWIACVLTILILYHSTYQQPIQQMALPRPYDRLYLNAILHLHQHRHSRPVRGHPHATYLRPRAPCPDEGRGGRRSHWCDCTFRTSLWRDDAGYGKRGE
jgi:hypothetical protein